MIKKIALFLVILFLLTPRPVLACSPGPSDPWYRIKIEIDKNTLPEGVDVSSSNRGYLPLRITNQVSIPLYVINNKNPQYYSQPAYSNNSELPYGLVPLYKLVNGEGYFYEADPDKFPEDPKWQRNDKERFDSSENELLLSEYLLDITGTGIKNVYQDNRPENLQPPTPEKFSMLVYYGPKPLTITGMVTYELNKDYDPKKLTKGVEFCEKFMRSQPPTILQRQIWIVPLVALGSLLSLLFIIHKIIKILLKRSKN